MERGACNRGSLCVRSRIAAHRFVRAEYAPTAPNRPHGEFSTPTAISGLAGPHYWVMVDFPFKVVGLSFLVALALMWLLTWRVDVNEFSMHHFYKNRLVRAYLGASRRRTDRRPNAFTGFDLADDLKLRACDRSTACRHCANGRAAAQGNNFRRTSRLCRSIPHRERRLEHYERRRTGDARAQGGILRVHADIHGI